MGMTFSELYKNFFYTCARHPGAQVIAVHSHYWEALEKALEFENRELYGLIEGTITAFSGMIFPVYMVGNIFDNYVNLKKELLDNNIAILYLTIDGDFVERKEVIFCCDNQQEFFHA